jgi:hypothetical protein
MMASISTKLSTSNSQHRFGMSISSCINGFRIRQHTSGEINAEFHFIFCYGSRSYSSWKQYSDFKYLADLIKSTAKFVQADFKNSIAAWKLLESRKRWFKSLSVKYLIEKSIYLGRFVEAVMLESPNPAIILCFLKCEPLMPSALSFVVKP